MPLVDQLAGGVKGGLALAGREGGHRRVVPYIVPIGGVPTRHSYQVLNNMKKISLN